MCGRTGFYGALVSGGGGGAEGKGWLYIYHAEGMVHINQPFLHKISPHEIWLLQSDFFSFRGQPGDKTPMFGGANQLV